MGAVCAAVGCNGGSAEDKPVIGHGGEYAQVLAEAERLSREPLEKLTREEELTEEDKQALVKSAAQFQALVDYEPSKFAPYLALGMIYRGIGNLEKAEQMLRQCILNIPPSNEEAIHMTSAEAHYQLSRVLFDSGNYEQALAEASTAVESHGDNPNYYFGKASALVQLNREKEAKEALKIALKLDPNHRLATGLQKLLNR